MKKERFDREHEDILREIRHGLLRYGGGKAPSSSRNNADETYMYDDDMLRHWYDEPPYESDPEELLMEHANNRYVSRVNPCGLRTTVKTSENVGDFYFFFFFRFSTERGIHRIVNIV